MFQYIDPDDGVVYEMNYVVTHTPSEGREYVEWRVNPRSAGSLAEASKYDQVHKGGWHRLPPWASVPEEAMAYWHGEVKTDHRQGVIVAMSNNSTEALCADWDGMYIADLQLFTNVSDPDGSEVSPGMVVEVGLEATKPLTDPEAIRTWMLAFSK